MFRRNINKGGLISKQLIETLDELNKIRADGKVKRANAEQELGRIEGELRQKMLEINN